jgi:hypothetical protein
VIVNQALTELGVEDEFEVHLFQGVSENDLRAELKPHTFGQQPLYVHMDAVGTRRSREKRT